MVMLFFALTTPLPEMELASAEAAEQPSSPTKETSTQMPQPAFAID
jgi:hypothetical protein